MSKEEKGFFDGLIEDFASTLEMKSAIEASRDENGKIDVAKATGISMGLGHMSDNDITMMGALLGAEGAFDDDGDTDFDSFDDLDDNFIPSIPIPNNTVPITQTIKPMTEQDYESKKAGIIAEKRFITVTAVIGLLLFTALFMYMMGSESNYTGVYFLFMCILDISLLFAISNTSKARERELEALENRYRESKHLEDEKKKAEQAKNELHNYAGTQDTATILNQICQKTKTLFDKADQASGMTEPTYNDSMIHTFLIGLIYCAVKECDIDPDAKAPLFDRAVSKANLESDFNGDMLFPECQQVLDETLQKLVNEIFTDLTIAAYKFSDPDDSLDFTKTVCSLMLILDKSINDTSFYAEFGKSAVHVTLTAAETAARRVIDEKLLG